MKAKGSIQRVTQKSRMQTPRDKYQVPVQTYYALAVKIPRSSRPEVFCKKGVLRNFTKFTGKHLCQSLFFNKGLWHRYFPENFVKFIRRPFFIEHLWWLHLNFMEVNILVADLREVTKNWMVLLVFREGCLCRNCTLYVRIIVTSHDILHPISCVWRYNHAPPPLSLSFLTCFFLYYKQP